MIYFVQAGRDGPIKIGFANNVARRIRTLATGHYEALVVLATTEGDKDLEHRVHVGLKNDRQVREWFLPSSSVMKAVEAAKLNKLAEAFPALLKASPRISKKVKTRVPAIKNIDDQSQLLLDSLRRVSCLSDRQVALLADGWITDRTVARARALGRGHRSTIEAIRIAAENHEGCDYKQSA